MKNKKRFKVIITVVLALTIILVGADIFIKLQFGTDYSHISYRFTPSDFKGFFKSIKYEDKMAIEMMELYFDSNNHIVGMDMNFSKEKDDPNYVDRYKSSYNIQGAGLSNLYYTGSFAKEKIDEKDRSTHQKWKNATPKIFKALSSFPIDEFYNVIPKADMYNIGIRDVVEMESNIHKNSWITKNTYLAENGSIKKITSEDNLNGDYAVFMLKLGIPKDIEQQVNDVLKSNPYETYMIYLSLNQ